MYTVLWFFNPNLYVRRLVDPILLETSLIEG